MASGYQSKVLASGLSVPRHIALDTEGNLLVAERGGSGIQRIVLEDNGGIDVCVASSDLLISNGQVSSVAREDAAPDAAEDIRDYKRNMWLTPASLTMASPYRPPGGPFLLVHPPTYTSTSMIQSREQSESQSISSQEWSRTGLTRRGLLSSRPRTQTYSLSPVAPRTTST